MAGISTAVGPLTGGLLIEFTGIHNGWRWVFLINLFIRVAELPLAIKLLPRRHEPEEHGLDPVGNLLLVGSPASTSATQALPARHRRGCTMSRPCTATYAPSGTRGLAPAAGPEN